MVNILNYSKFSNSCFVELSFVVATNVKYSAAELFIVISWFLVIFISSIS